MRKWLTVLGLLFVAGSAWPAAIVRYVDTASTAGGNGTTASVVADDPNRAYATLQAWETAEQCDLTDNGGDTMTVYCAASTGVADTTAVNVWGWTTGAQNNITIEVPQAVRHDGEWDTAAYRLSVANANVLGISEEFVTVDGLQVQQSSTSGGGQCVLFVSGIGASNAIAFRNCIVRQSGTTIYQTGGIAFIDTDIVGTIQNCIAYGASGTVQNVSNTPIYLQCASASVYNCTADGGYSGMYRAAGAVVAKNNLVTGAASACFSGTFDGASDYNASSDGTAPGAHSRVGQTFVFVGAAGEAGGTLGEELVTNGGFDADSDWTKGTGWTITTGTANCSGAQNPSNSALSQALSGTNGQLLRGEFTISNYSAGSFKLYLGAGGGSDSAWTAADGTTVFYRRRLGTLTYNLANGTFVGSIDNVSVTKVGEDYHLDPTDTGATGFGVDLRPAFSTDIDGDARGGVWDIGADQISPAANLPAIMAHLRRMRNQ